MGCYYSNYTCPKTQQSLKEIFCAVNKTNKMTFKDTQIVKKTVLSGCDIEGEISFKDSCYNIQIKGSFLADEVNELIKKLTDIVKSNG